MHLQRGTRASTCVDMRTHMPSAADMYIWHSVYATQGACRRQERSARQGRICLILHACTHMQNTGRSKSHSTASFSETYSNHILFPQSAGKSNDVNCFAPFADVFDSSKFSADAQSRSCDRIIQETGGAMASAHRCRRNFLPQVHVSQTSLLRITFVLTLM